CPAGMVDVEGDYCPWVTQTCLRWLDPETKMRCAEFAPTSECLTKTVRKHFCMDKYEYPNRAGADPVVMKTWYEARTTCASEGKRLCNESEWTLACEGEERLPYPYGYARSSEACNIDKPHPDVDEKALANPKTRQAEADRLWQGEPSGSREACVSPFGVHDMTGNVDEWVVNESGKPYKSALKGGYWGPVKTRCRPSTVAHNEDFSFYQIGFRCCSDPSNEPSGGSGVGGGSKVGSKGINAKPATSTGSPLLAGS
ncbi:MAG TPA: SUMF1/EgtB/PvdO family nonheme iron enzyme, partial [Polyangiaceae bacterium]